MGTEPDNAIAADPGSAILVMLLRFLGIGADAKQLRHRCAQGTIGAAEMLRCAKEFGLKARLYRTNWDRLPTTPLPGIAVLRDGGYLLLGKVGEGKAIVQSPLSSRPALMTRAELEAVWDGQL